MHRNDGFDFERRESRFYGDTIDNVKIAWTSELASSQGAHYHCWIDGTLPKVEKEVLLKKFQHAAFWKGDPVSFSYDHLPECKGDLQVL